MKRKHIARDTVQILQRGHYDAPNGDRIELAEHQLACINNTRCYDPKELAQIRRKVLSQAAPFTKSEFEVVNETTLSGAARIAAGESPQERVRVGVLNFASAKNPGGGFLKGAHAQEESLARSSGLYKSLRMCRSYYDYHRSQRSCLYSDRMIYSPSCPVFRKDNGTLLAKPYLVDFITSPAPNAGAIWRNERQNVPKIAQTLKERSSKVLSLAAYHGCDVLVLGAWGCGVFRNDPVMVANAFFEHLAAHGEFWGRFKKVRFAVLDTSRSKNNYRAFYERFG